MNKAIYLSGIPVFAIFLLSKYWYKDKHIDYAHLLFVFVMLLASHAFFADASLERLDVVSLDLRAEWSAGDHDQKYYDQKADKEERRRRRDCAKLSQAEKDDAFRMMMIWNEAGYEHIMQARCILLTLPNVRTSQAISTAVHAAAAWVTCDWRFRCVAALLEIGLIYGDLLIDHWASIESEIESANHCFMQADIYAVRLGYLPSTENDKTNAPMPWH